MLTQWRLGLEYNSSGDGEKQKHTENELGKRTRHNS